VAFLVLAVVGLTLLDVAVEAVVRLRLQKKRELRQRFWRD
jgi:hypothetical protein